MTNQDNKELIFEQALSELRQGTGKTALFSKFPQHKTELTEMLQIAQMLKDLPKNSLTQPAMRRKYILHPVKRLWFMWLPISRFVTVSASCLLLISAGLAAGYSVKNSVPGETLFSVKHAAEQLQLKFISNPQEKANLQLAIAQKRLSDAETVFNSPNANPEKEKAALLALVAETKNSIDQVGTAAKNNSLDVKNHPLVASLENLNNQQQKLIKEIKPATDINTAAKDALAATTENTSRLSEIKLYMAIASNERTLAKLNAVSITGSLTQISKDSITVENTAFIINPDTVIKDSDGNKLLLAKLELKSKVSVEGSKDNGKILALQITLILPDKASVEGAATGTPEQVSPSTTPVSLDEKKATSTETLKKLIPTPSPSPSSLQIDPNTTIGSFIIENPLPASTTTKP